jgi:hypothetical protein
MLEECRVPNPTSPSAIPMEAAISTVARGGMQSRETDRFLNLSDPEEQVEYWDRRLETQSLARRCGWFTCSAPARHSYASPFIRSLPQKFGPLLRARLQRAWATHPNRGNSYAASLLLGRPTDEPKAAEFPIQFVCADAADFFGTLRTSEFNAFSLSNIGDGAFTVAWTKQAHFFRHFFRTRPVR